MTESVRLDRFLCAARLFKSRTLAQTACEANHVRINGEPARSSSPLRVGDEIRAFSPRGSVVWQVLKLADVTVYDAPLLPAPEFVRRLDLGLNGDANAIIAPISRQEFELVVRAAAAPLN